MMQRRITQQRGDRGAVLVLVLVVSIVLALVVIGLATYTTTTLRYGQTTESRADRFAASQAAMDNAIERLEIKRSLCGTGVANEIIAFPEIINDSPAEVVCRSIGGTAGDVEGWAIVITGVGNPTDDLIVQSGGGTDKFIGGPVWMENPMNTDVKVPTYIADGDLWYPGGCAPNELSDLDSDPGWDTRLRFSAGHGTMCTTGSWSAVFRPPATSVPNTVSSTDGVPVTPDTNGCTVFEPGLYNTAPNLGDFNYFKSGNYYFRNVGTITIKDSRVLFGNISDLEGFPSIENSPCNVARGQDSTSGATVYVGGSTRFDVDANGALEFSRRAQISSQKTDRVSLQVLDPGLGGQPSWSDPVIETKSGNGKEVAVQGLIWAPAAGVQFDAVTNDTTAVLRGGAVVAMLDAGASASATDFLIEVPTTDIERVIELTSTSTNEASLQIRVVLDWRISNGETALKTWRVCEQSGC